MEVKELIERLKKCKPNADVYIQDSEFGETPLSEVEEEGEFVYLK